MNIKTFFADSSQEALRMVKEALGPEAVILRTRKVQGSRNQAGKACGRIEVTAAVDFESAFSRDSLGAMSGEGPFLSRWARLESEIHDIKDLLWSAGACRQLEPEVRFDPELRDRYAHYRSFGLNPQAINTLMPPKSVSVPGTAEGRRQRLRESLLDVLHRIPVNGNAGVSEGKRVFAFVGPTGVGKTTTLAKLAALKVVQEKKRVALVTVDTFRIAAVAQLETYARIMGVPLSVAMNRDELQQALSRHRDCDVIFIDTAGRSPNNSEEISQLAAVLDVDEEVHLHLLLSAANRYRELVNVETRFGVLPLKSYIITKLDEVTDASSVINFLISRPRPLSYLTTGQRVPEDIEPASRKRLASMILARGGALAANSIGEVTRHGSSQPAERHG